MSPGAIGAVSSAGGFSHVAVHADRRGVNEAPHAGAGRRFEQPPRAAHVDLAVVRVGVPGRAVHRGHVQHGVAPVDERRERALVREVAGDHGRGERADPLAAARRAAQEDAHLVAARAQRLEQPSSRVPGSPGESDAHGGESVAKDPVQP